MKQYFSVLRAVLADGRWDAFEDLVLALAVVISAISAVAGVAWWALGNQPFGAALGDAVFVGMLAWAAAFVVLFVGATVQSARASKNG